MFRVGAKVLLFASLLPLITSCTADREQEGPVLRSAFESFAAGKPPELRPHLMVYTAQGQRNRALNANRIGLASLEMGHFDLARQMFDQSLADIEAVYGDTEQARQARSNFFKESVKDYKGEPYERSMAYFYRALLYLVDGDYDNARASFKGGDLQNTMAADDKFKSVFVAFPYLQGWSARCRNDPGLAEEDFELARSYRPAITPPDPADNLLIIAESGEAPIKYSAAIEDAESVRVIKFRKSGVANRPRLAQPSIQEVAAVPDQVTPAIEEMDDVYFHATTRGGRVFDGILQGKAVAKATAETVGGVAETGAMLAGGIAAVAAMSNDRNVAMVAGITAVGLLVADLAARGVAKSIETDADTRYWDNLPQKLFVKTMKAKTGASAINVEFLDRNGFVKTTRSATIRWAGRCGIAWLRSESALPRSPRAPYSVPGDVMGMPVITDDPPAKSK
ncbi:MAG: hypothetical protein ABT940_13410 [Alphaproteobacteria bacterium]